DRWLVAAKGMVTVRALIDSYGRPLSEQVRVSVSLNDKEVAAEQVTLERRKNNEAKISFDAPAERGEYKLTVRVQNREGGDLKTRSAGKKKIESFLTVTREGVSVLLVERQARFSQPRVLRAELATGKR